VGVSQLLAAVAHPRILAGICPVVTGSNYHDGWTYQGGAFEQAFNEAWTSGMAQDTFSHFVQRNTDPRLQQWTLPLDNHVLFNLSPFPADHALSQVIAPYFYDWLAHPSTTTIGKRWSVPDHFADINVPALHVAAWYDIFPRGSLPELHWDQGAWRSGRACRQQLHRDYRRASGSGRKIGTSTSDRPPTTGTETAVVLGCTITCSKHPEPILHTSQ